MKNGGQGREDLPIQRSDLNILRDDDGLAEIVTYRRLDTEAASGGNGLAMGVRGERGVSINASCSVGVMRDIKAC